jgi:hypothetical protein
MSFRIDRILSACAAVATAVVAPAGPADLDPIDICLTVGHPHPCVPFSDEHDGGWAIVEMAPGEQYPSLPVGAQFRVTGVFCPDCVHWFCGEFVGNIFQAQIINSCFIGDLDEDGVVGGADLGILLLAWGECSRGAACPADLSGDGAVDGEDLGTLLLNWTE